MASYEITIPRGGVQETRSWTGRLIGVPSLEEPETHTISEEEFPSFLAAWQTDTRTGSALYIKRVPR